MVPLNYRHLNRYPKMFDMDIMVNVLCYLTDFSDHSLTLTSAVSRWQFLHERPIPEKALSGWSNLFSFAFRKNVEKGSYRHKTGFSL